MAKNVTSALGMSGTLHYFLSEILLNLHLAVGVSVLVVGPLPAVSQLVPSLPLARPAAHDAPHDENHDGVGHDGGHHEENGDLLKTPQ